MLQSIRPLVRPTRISIESTPYVVNQSCSPSLRPSLHLSANVRTGLGFRTCMAVSACSY